MAEADNKQSGGSGSSSSSKSITGPTTTLPNGFVRYSVSGTEFDVRPHYKLQKVLGLGSYGLVCSAMDELKNRKVAIKKCRNVFKDIGDCKRVLREVKLLRFMRHENVLHSTDFYLGGNGDEFNEIYIVTPFFDADLSTVIRSKAALSEQHLRYFFYQVLRGLKYIHSSHVVHRDLKPANLLVQLNCDLVIGDFGLARSDKSTGILGTGVDIEMTDYVVTRWYRPPELLMLNKHYGPAVDIWSAGCIFAELFTRRPLFTGSDYIRQLRMICEAIGVPSDEDLAVFEKADAKAFVTSFRGVAPQPLEKVVPALSGNPQALDMLGKMLQFNPAKRWTAAQLMAHPYMEGLHDPTDEPDAETDFVWAFPGDEAGGNKDSGAVATLLRQEFIAENAKYAKKLAATQQQQQQKSASAAPQAEDL